MESTDQEKPLAQEKPLDFRRFVNEKLLEKGHHPQSKSAMIYFKELGSAIQAPEGLTTKVALYEELESLGLKNDSPLFCLLFDTYSRNLKLR